MMTSKERAALRAQANPLEVTLIVGKSGISQTLLDEARHIQARCEKTGIQRCTQLVYIGKKA